MVPVFFFKDDRECLVVMCDFLGVDYFPRMYCQLILAGFDNDREQFEGLEKPERAEYMLVLIALLMGYSMRAKQDIDAFKVPWIALQKLRGQSQLSSLNKFGVLLSKKAQEAGNEAIVTYLEPKKQNLSF